MQLKRLDDNVDAVVVFREEDLPSSRRRSSVGDNKQVTDAPAFTVITSYSIHYTKLYENKSAKFADIFHITSCLP